MLCICNAFAITVATLARHFALPAELFNSGLLVCFILCVSFYANKRCLFDG